MGALVISSSPSCGAEWRDTDRLNRSRLLIAIVAAVVAFAANSILCRLALRPPARIDPASFTSVRLISGALALYALTFARGAAAPSSAGSWRAAAALFLYAIAFSLAYIRLPAATGALILFAAVQFTMVAIALARGERPRAMQWAGLTIALAGLVILTAPGVTAPHPAAAIAMALAGMAWGVYSILGGGSRNPLADTARNFIRTVPLAIVTSVVALRVAHVTPAGVLLATASGILASGLGYTIWYTALPHLTATRAAVVQLAVPLVAAAAGIALLGETATIRFALATVAILTGIAMNVFGRASSRWSGQR